MSVDGTLTSFWKQTAFCHESYQHLWHILHREPLVEARFCWIPREFIEDSESV